MSSIRDDCVPRLQYTAVYFISNTGFPHILKIIFHTFSIPFQYYIKKVQYHYFSSFFKILIMKLNFAYYITLHK